MPIARGAPRPTSAIRNARCADVADARIAAFVQKDPIALRLTTPPGVGSMTANAFVATIDDITRFRTAHELEAYKFHSRAVRIRQWPSPTRSTSGQ